MVMLVLWWYLFQRWKPFFPLTLKTSNCCIANDKETFGCRSLMIFHDVDQLSVGLYSPVILKTKTCLDQLLGFSLPFSSFCPLGIIDLSQVPHLPVLVPPSAGAASSPMDRITYIPGGSTTFPGRPYTTSPISPGTIQFTQANSPKDQICSTQIVFIIFFSLHLILSSWVLAYEQDTKHIVRT